RFGPRDRLERPVPLPARPLIDPLLQDLDLRSRQLLARFWRGHDFVAIGARDAREEFALSRLPRPDHRIRRPETALFDNEGQVGLSRFLVRSMAREAILGENRQDFAAKIDWRLCQS